jgi:hypothetical protein
MKAEIIAEVSRMESGYRRMFELQAEWSQKQIDRLDREIDLLKAKARTEP